MPLPCKPEGHGPGADLFAVAVSTARVSQDGRPAGAASSGGVPLSAQMFPWPEAPRFGACTARDASFMD